MSRRTAFAAADRLHRGGARRTAIAAGRTRDRILAAA
jgi:hypothetical protein